MDEGGDGRRITVVNEDILRTANSSTENAADEGAAHFAATDDTKLHGISVDRFRQSDRGKIPLRELVGHG